MSTLSQFFGSGGGGFPKLAPSIRPSFSAASINIDLAVATAGENWNAATLAAVAVVNEWETFVDVTGSGMLHGVLIHSVRSGTHEARITIDGVPYLMELTSNRAQAMNCHRVGWYNGTTDKWGFLPTGLVRFETSLLVERRSTDPNTNAIKIGVSYSLDA